MTVIEKLKAFYGKFDIIIEAVIKFAIAFIALKLMSDRLCYISLFENPFVLIIIALICSLLPYGLMAAVLSLCLVANVYKASMEMAVILAFFLIIIALLYYSFHPGDPVVLILTPVLFALKIPYVIPLIVGLAGSVISVVPMCCGIVIYFMLAFVKGTPAVIAVDDKISITDLPDRFLSIIDGVVKNKEMWLAVVIFAAVLVIVYVIHKIPFKYSWYVAVGAGTLVFILSALVMKVDMSIVMILLSCAAACVYILFVYDVDYRRTERLQFEDDEYYYYVTAIPKISAETFYRVKETKNTPDKKTESRAKTEIRKRDLYED